MKLFVFLGCSLFLIALCSSDNGDIKENLEITNIERTIDLATHLAKISCSISIKNTGSTSATSFVFAMEKNFESHIAFIEGTIKDKAIKLKVSKLSGKTSQPAYAVELESALGAGAETTVDVYYVLAHAVKPYPTHIGQADNQLVTFKANLYVTSPYNVIKQVTNVELPSTTIESYTKTKPTSLSDKVIKYGPYENVEPSAESELAVHYENNSPFLTATSVERWLEVSHWGNVAVEETVWLQHTGALLKGFFSRFDYQRSHDGGASVQSFKTLLPAAAADVYYRDEIGNISTSALRNEHDFVEVDLRPRFPLFGGWKTNYVLGYNLPSYQYLYNKGDRYVLKMRLVDHIYDDQVVEDLVVKIVLPEGSHSIKVRTPYAVVQGPETVHATYLDTTGRPVVTLNKLQLVENHIDDFEVEYTFEKWRMVREPLLVVASLYLLFLAVIVYVRLDFAISKDEVSEIQMRVSSLIEQFQGLRARRSALYQGYEDAINKLKAAKDGAAFAASRKKIDADFKSLTQQVASVIAQVKAESPEAADKMLEVQQLDVQMKDMFNQKLTTTESLVAGSTTKVKYLELISAVNGKVNDNHKKTEALLSSL